LSARTESPCIDRFPGEIMSRLNVFGSPLLGILAALATAAGEERKAADLLPSTTVIYSELPAPPRVFDLVLEHPLRRRLEALDDYKKAFETPQYAHFQFGLSMVEQQLGMKWREALNGLTEGGVHIAIDGPTLGTVMLAKARDAAMLEKAKETLLRLVREDASRKGESDPIRAVEYRGVQAYRIQDSRFATVGSWLVVTNKDDLGKSILDAWLDGGKSPLSKDADFVSSRRETASGDAPLFWTFVRLRALRDAGIAKELFRGKTDNPLAELLAGGIMSTLRNAPYASSAVYGTRDRVRWTLNLPYQPEWVPESRHFYLGPTGEGTASLTLSTPSSILSLSTYRDLSGLWNSSSDLFEADVNAKIAQANSQLTTLFAGRDFGLDVLASFRPEMQLVIARQTFESPELTPEIKLPSLALVFRLKDPEKTLRQWKVTFQSLIGFLNVVGSMNGQPPLELNMETVDGVQFVTAAYVPKESKESEPVPINFNASPSVCFIKDLFIVSTTRQLAQELARSARASGPNGAAAAEKANTRLQVDFAVLKQALADNLQHLVSQNMIQKGHARKDAEKEIGTLLEILNSARGFGARLERQAEQLQLSLDLQFEP